MRRRRFEVGQGSTGGGGLLAGIGRGPLVLVGLAMAGLAFIGCTGSGSRPQAEAENGAGAADPTVERPSRTELKPTITLGVTDWTGARINVAIAEQLIERRLGFPVEPVPVVDPRDMLRDLESGELSAVLEIWSSSLLAEELDIVDSGSVDRLGELGVVGKIGWYVPRYVLDQQPELKTWQGLTDPGIAAIFAAAGTGGKGRFLATDPSYEQHDAEIIEALGLSLEVVYSGSEEQTTSAVEQAVAAREPILLYWWSPTAEIPRFDLVDVELPARTAQCQADIDAGLPQACDYPVDRLIKLGSPQLIETAPEVHRLLSLFSLSTEDQLAMIDRVDNRGQPVDSVVADWISANETRWETWLE